MRKIFLFTSLLSCFHTLMTQELIIKNGLHGFLDNREYFNKYTDHQTFFGNRIYSFGNFSFKNYDINIGFDYTYEFGSFKNNYKPKLIANYNYYDEKIDFSIGTFHRKNYLNYPIALLTDSLEYYRPLMEGTILRYKFKYGYQQVWLDWTGRQTEVIRESFLAGLSGLYNISNFFIENYIVMYHLALPGNNINHFHIRDNGGASIMAGYKFKPSKVIDSLLFKAGEIYAYDRIRGEYDVKNYLNTFFGLEIYKKKLFFSAIFNTGDGLEVVYGEEIYRAPRYGRFDIGLMPFKNKPDNKVCLSLHYVDGKINYSQLINIHIQFDILPFKMTGNSKI